MKVNAVPTVDYAQKKDSTLWVSDLSSAIDLAARNQVVVVVYDNHTDA